MSAACHRLVVILALAGLVGACVPMNSRQAPPPRPPGGLHDDCSHDGDTCQPGLYCYKRESILGNNLTMSTCERVPDESPASIDHGGDPPTDGTGAAPADAGGPPA